MVNSIIKSLKIALTNILAPLKSITIVRSTFIARNKISTID